MDGVNKIYEEPALTTVSKLGDKMLNMVCTSPPYWQQRDYGHPDQWGLEPTYHEYLEHLWQLMGSERNNDGLWRVLRDDGTVWVNLGDSYSKSGGSGSKEYFEKGHTQFGKIEVGGRYIQPHSVDDMPSKTLMLLPHRFAIGCIERGWRVRNDICWIKPNCQPESVEDRFSKKKEYFFLLTKSEDYYFDLDSIRDEPSEGAIKSNQYAVTRRGIHHGTDPKLVPSAGRSTQPGEQINPLGKNPGDVSWFWDEPGKWTFEEYMEMCANWYYDLGDIWEISTRASNEDHFATYNYKLVQKPIIAGCPEFICKRCGNPRKKLYEKKSFKRSELPKEMTGYRPNDYESKYAEVNGGKDARFTSRKFVGWIECKCNAGFRPGIIYDPFAGTGTTIRQAIVNNRWAIGSELVPKNVKRANESLGLFANQKIEL